MTPRFNEPLAPKTTLGIGGPARVFVLAQDDTEIAQAAAYAQQEHLPLRVLGAGSNVLVPDVGIEAVVVRLGARGISFEAENDTVLVTADAGVVWDALVDAATDRGLYGVENLAGVPGTVGGAVVQNIGAYGAAFSDVFAYADTYNVRTGASERIAATHAHFGYRASVFKQRRELVILRATLRLSEKVALKLGYPDLARYQSKSEPLADSAQVATAVRSIRAQKFPDLRQEGTAGSFFANPIMSEERARLLAERFPGLPLFTLPESPGLKKVPLAWILEHVLHLKGFTSGAVRLYEKHALVLVATHAARACDVDALAEEVARRVEEATGMCIEREVETYA